MFDAAVAATLGHNGGPPMVLDLAQRPLPEQNMNAILMHADRYYRGVDGMRDWIETGKKAVDYFEGKQWSASDLAKLEKQGRPALTINRIKPLVLLAHGFFLNNRTDISFTPGNDGTGSAEGAMALSHCAKHQAQANQMSYVDAEVYLDGILTGRGWYDARMDFEDNIFGEAKWRAQDPFSVIPDADGESYDPATWNHVMTQRWISVDEIGHNYGAQAMSRIGPFVNSMGAQGQFNSIVGADRIIVSPSTSFSQDSRDAGAFRDFRGAWQDWVDPYRKNVRMLDMQHYVRAWRWHFVDMETGDRSPVPDHWSADRVQRVLNFALQNGSRLLLQNLAVRRLRWTHMVGDVIVFDEWSPYRTPTLIPFFPYFRRGATRGLVEDLIGPQDEVNVRRSARLNITGRTANGGWKVAKGSLDPDMVDRLERDGGKPGFNIIYDSKGGTLPPPTEINVGASPVAQRELEHEAQSDMEYISGINKSALGQDDGTNTSGRAVLARQQGTVIGLEMFQDNYHRSKHLGGRKTKELVQGFYTEERIMRVQGENGANPVQMTINRVTANGIINNVTIGNYEVELAERSLSESFLAAQFAELSDMRQQGIPVPSSHIIDASSYGRKEELKAAVAAAEQAQAAAGVPPGGAGGPPKPGGQPPGRKAEPGGPPSIQGPLGGSPQP